MIVMSYRSPWENRGTEKGEGGRGNQRTHTQKEVDCQEEKTSNEQNGDKLAKTGYQYLL